MASPACVDDLRRDRKLARFIVEGKATDRQLGTGTYGSVEEASIYSTLYDH